VILNGLPPGPHKVLLVLETANHQLLDKHAVSFTVPQAARATSDAAHNPSETRGTTPAAKITVDAPDADALSRGVLSVSYRTENLHIVPVYGPAALAVSPQIGHIHVTVDDAAWHWADASGNPVIVSGLAPGPHKILIELVNPNHQPVDQCTVQFTLPRPEK
jgi:hypothetical protein